MRGTKTLLSYILFLVGIQYKVICRLPPPVCEKDHFTCANTECIPNFWQCDGTDDCGDDSDESDCPVSGPGEECDADEMKCNNARCVNIEWKCDSEDDCGDNTDETNCTAIHQERQCDGSTNFRCANGKCVPRSWTCNKIDDCGDNSDESTAVAPYCVPFTGCKEGYFQCNATRTCIHNVLRCDRNFNCGVDKYGVTDKSDEELCEERTCGPREYKCDNGRCISKQWACDKQNDCGDGSDERNCSIKSCRDDEFKCVLSGHCVDAKYRCDDYRDCLDGSDEKGCPSGTTQAPTVTTTKSTYTLVSSRPSLTTGVPTKTYVPVSSCSTGEYKCKGETRCIRRSWVCDGEPDCTNDDDESPEICSSHKCESGHFECKNKLCIQQKNVCDGHDHCGDNSDEQNCEGVEVPCSNTSYTCKGSHRCIPLSSLCDKRSDCPLDDDEDASCGVNECLVNNGGCVSICRDLPIGYKCECIKGYELDKVSKKCVDINECHVFGKCSQACVNYKGSFACQCDKGYNMDPQEHRCRANGPLPFLFFTNRFDIRKVSSNGREMKLVANTRSVSSLALSYAEKMLYWADNGLKTISRMLINGTGKTEVLIQNVTKSDGVAVDYLGKKLYWTDTVKNHIGVSNLDGSHSKVLYEAGDHEDIRSLEVYPEKGYIFWTNWGGHSKIERSNLDGSNKTSFLSEGLIWPTALAIDKTNDRLYWTELNSICTIHINGGGYKRIIHGLTRPFGLAVFEDFIYWTDKIEKVIYKANKFNGLDMQKIEGRYTHPLDIAVYHPLIQAAVSHPCKHTNGGCSHLCFNTPTGKSVCACPQEMKLNADGKTCTGPSILTPAATKEPTTKAVKVETTIRQDTTEKMKPTITVKIATQKVTTKEPETTIKNDKTITVVKKTASTTLTKETTAKVETTTVATIKPKTTKQEKVTVKVTSTPTTATEVVKPETMMPVVINQLQKADESHEEEGTKTVYIIVGVLCLIGTVFGIVFAVVCFRKRRHYDLSMVYEPQRDMVHEKDEEEKKDDIDSKKFIIAPKKMKAFENVNFKNTDGVVHIPINMDDDMTDEVLSDNSSDICFDDRAPIMGNML